MSILTTSCPRRWLALLAFVLAAPAWAQADRTADRITASVQRRGDLVIVDVSARVAAPLADTWATLTDYEHMASFIADLKTSRVLRREGNQLEVQQAGAKSIGMFSVAFASVRAVELVPMREIRTKLVSGDFKRYESATRFSEDGADTLIVYHGEYVPTSWVPPVVGPSFIEDETKKHYGQMVAEVLRRRAAGGAAR